MRIYIFEQGKKEGPFDLITVIKKIRNRTVTPGTLVIEGEESAPVPAGSHAKLREFFHEVEMERRAAPAQEIRARSFGMVASSGWLFLQANPVASVYTGIFVLAVIVLATLAHLLLPEPLHVLGYFAVMIISFYLLSAYMLALLRISHGQPVEAGYILRSMGRHTQPLLAAASVVALLTLVGMVLLAVPGLFVLTVYIFTPLLIAENGMEFWDAMESSRKAIMARGTDMLGIIFGLVVINFISAMLVIPLLVSLPLTFGAISELYDEFFYHTGTAA